MVPNYKITVPASSANIGPGYDVLGVALGLFLHLDVTIDQKNAGRTKADSNNCLLTYTPDSEGYDSVPLESSRNLITQTALYVLRCNNISSFPEGTTINVHNEIPLGRGLGSSGAAVVAGVLLANQVGQFGYSKQRMLDFCLMIERHPDNITAAMTGGFCASFIRDLTPTEIDIRDVPLTELLSCPKDDDNAKICSPIPPLNIGRHVQYGWNSNIKCIAVIPKFQLKTADSRNVLPSVYNKTDVVFNMQRLAVLTKALTETEPDPNLIYAAMQDKIHQPYRKMLIPGLVEILENISPATHSGLLGLCLSGAGPTILALANDNFVGIANDIINICAKNKIECTWQTLEVCCDGATVETKTP